MAAGRAQSVTFRDSKGNIGTTRWYMASAALVADANADLAAIEALSNAAVQKETGVSTGLALPVAYGAAATYESIEDKAVMVFATSVGEIHRYQVPAPKSAIFLADQETVDATNALVKTFVANFTAATYLGTAPTATTAVVSRGGLSLVLFLGGTRARRKLHRRFNIYTLNPAETGIGE